MRDAAEPSVEQEVEAVLPEKRAKALLDIYRKMTLEDREEVKRAQEEIDNA
jgi:hypothetical protein